MTVTVSYKGIYSPGVSSVWGKQIHHGNARPVVSDSSFKIKRVNFTIFGLIKSTGLVFLTCLRVQLISILTVLEWL